MSPSQTLSGRIHPLVSPKRMLTVLGSSPQPQSQKRGVLPSLSLSLLHTFAFIISFPLFLTLLPSTPIISPCDDSHHM